MVPKFISHVLWAFWAKRACVYMLVLEFDYPKSLKFDNYEAKISNMSCDFNFYIWILLFETKIRQIWRRILFNRMLYKIVLDNLHITRLSAERAPQFSNILLHTTYIFISLINLHVLQPSAWAGQPFNLWT